MVPVLLTVLTGCPKKKPVTPQEDLNVETTTVAPPADTATEVQEPTEPAMEDQDEDPLLSQDLQVVNDELRRRGFSSDVYFNYDEDSLSDETRERLARNAELLRSQPQFQLTIEGHADERGTNEYNLALGERRANAVRDYLGSLGVAGDRSRTLSYGEERPVCTDDRRELLVPEPPRPHGRDRPLQRRLMRIPASSLCPAARRGPGRGGLRLHPGHRGNQRPAVGDPAPGPAGPAPGLEQRGRGEPGRPGRAPDGLAPQDRGRHAGQAPGRVAPDRRAAGQAGGHQLPAVPAVAADRGDQPGAQVLPAGPAAARRGPAAGVRRPWWPWLPWLQHSGVQSADSDPAAGRHARPLAGGSDPKSLYDASYNDYLKGNHDLAIRGFQQYLDEFPGTDLADNATYWIGESYYRQRRFRQAIQQFDEVLARYGRSDKTAGALLKKGYSHLELGERAPGIGELQKVLRQFPTSDEANLARQRLREIGVDIR